MYTVSQQTRSADYNYKIRYFLCIFYLTTTAYFHVSKRRTHTQIDCVLQKETEGVTESETETGTETATETEMQTETLSGIRQPEDIEKIDFAIAHYFASKSSFSRFS